MPILPNIPLHIKGDSQLSRVDQFKYLGVIFTKDEMVKTHQLNMQQNEKADKNVL